MLTLKIIWGLTIILTVPFLLASCGIREPSPRAEGVSWPGHKNHTEQLFQQCGKSLNRSLSDRIEAATELSKQKEGECWIILLLLDRTALDDPGDGPFPEEMRPTSDQFDMAVVAALLQNLTGETGNAVLLAVTTKLSDNRQGRFSAVEGGFPFGRNVDKETKPIRDLARDTLVRVLGVDHGYDVEKWRKEILKDRDHP